MRARLPHTALLGEWLLLLTFALLYAATLDTGLQPYELHGGDLITHQYAQVQARPSNAPGYPLYTMGGWLWFHGWRSLLRLGGGLPNPMPILSSYSTVWALFSLWLLMRIVRRLTRTPDQPQGNWPLALLLTAFYGVTYFFWYYATTTEQYSSAIAHTLAILYLYLCWREQTQRLSLLYALAFLCGLSLAHMLTVALIVPGLVAVVLVQAPWMLRRPRIVITAAAAAALPLVSYAYVYLRGAHHPEWWGAGDWSSPQAWFWSFVSTAQGREELLWAFEPGRPFSANGFPELIWQELSIPLLLLGLVGILGFDRRLRFLLVSTLLFYLGFCWAYRFGNWFQVILPAYPLILLGIVPPVERWRAWVVRRAGPDRRSFLAAAPLVLLGLALVWRVDQSLPRADSRHRPEDTALTRAAQLLAEPLPAHAGLFAPVNDALALAYLTQIWQIRPDLAVVSSAQATDVLAAGRPLFATWEAVPTLYAEMPQGDLLAVQGFGAEWVQLAAPAQLTADTALSGATNTTSLLVTPGLSLTGYTAQPAPGGAPANAGASPDLDVTLFWRVASGVWPAELAASVRPLRDGSSLLDASGSPIQQDRTRPVHGLWRDLAEPQAVLIADGYRLPRSRSAQELLVIVYTSGADGFHNLAEIRLPVPQPQ